MGLNACHIDFSRKKLKFISMEVIFSTVNISLLTLSLRIDFKTLTSWHIDVVTTSRLTLSHSYGKVENENCGNVSFRLCEYVRRCQDAATTLLQRRCNINQWLCRCFLIRIIVNSFLPLKRKRVTNLCLIKSTLCLLMEPSVYS